MTQLTDWERPHFEPGGGSPFLLYVVFGAFPPELPAFSRSAYSSAGPGEGFEICSYNRHANGEWIDGWIDWYLGRELERTNPALFAQIREAPECISVEVHQEDPDTLNYLRDAIGFATFLLDNGGVALLDPQTIRYYAPGEWKRSIFEPGRPQPNQQVVILVSEEDEDPELEWIHTRGLRKFGRPDLSVHGVSASYRDAVLDLVGRFIGLQALGGRIEEGQVVRMRCLPEGLTCHHQGNLDDPNFNNVHVEIRGASLAG